MVLNNTMDQVGRIGYLVPEFPNQTHIMFWREYQALGALGVDCQLLSSRRPNRKLMSHVWSEDAARNTNYLYPLSRTDLVRAIGFALWAGPAAWMRCAKAVWAAEMSPDDKLRLVGLIPFAAKLASLARRENLSHTHVGSCGDVANVAMFARLLGGPTYSLSLLGPQLDTYGPNQVQKWKHARFGLFQSEQLYREARVRIGEDLPEKSCVAPIGVDVEVMKRKSPYVPWRGEGPCQIYSCARLNPVKGHIYLIEAVKHLRDEHGIDAHLVLAGEDKDGGQGYRKVIETFVGETGMTPHVKLLGAVSEERNWAENAAAHIYAMASLDEAAGAVAAMEAMAMMVPVVMTDVGATRELIEDGVDALMVPTRDPVSLAEAIHGILMDPDRAIRLGKAGREKVVAKFSHWRSATQIRDFLRSRP